MITDRQVLEYYFKRVVKANSADECWSWTGTVLSTGYGQAHVQWIKYSIHRLSWELHYHEEIPDGMSVLHRCDNRICSNPEHLFIGTRKDNYTDSALKGRNAHGINHKRTKLTEAQVLEVLASTDSESALAFKFNVSPATISHIRTGRNWKHLTGRIHKDKISMYVPADPISVILNRQ